MRRIQAVYRSYLWEGVTGYSRAPLIRLSMVCQPKESGGLALLDGIRWNQAAVGKFVWWIFCKANHLWVKWVNHIYIANGDWFAYRPNANSSWAWHNICETKKLLKNGYTLGKWMGDDRGYSIGSGYKWLVADGPKVRWFNYLWSRFNIPK